jgi:hypothetical protein
MARDRVLQIAIASPDRRWASGLATERVPRSPGIGAATDDRLRPIASVRSATSGRSLSTAGSDATWPIGSTAPARKRSCPVGGDRFLPTGLLGLLLSARMLAVGSDHPARRAGTIGFVTERSSGGGAPGSPSWAIARAAAVGPIVSWTHPARSSAAIGSRMITDIERHPLADKLTASGTAATPGRNPRMLAIGRASPAARKSQPVLRGSSSLRVGQAVRR